MSRWRERWAAFRKGVTEGLGLGCGLVMGAALALVTIGWVQSL